MSPTQIRPSFEHPLGASVRTSSVPEFSTSSFGVAQQTLPSSLAQILISETIVSLLAHMSAGGLRSCARAPRPLLSPQVSKMAASGFNTPTGSTTPPAVASPDGPPRAHGKGFGARRMSAQEAGGAGGACAQRGGGSAQRCIEHAANACTPRRRARRPLHAPDAEARHADRRCRLTWPTSLISFVMCVCA